LNRLASRRRRRGKTTRGFTLVELLVTVILGGLMIALLMGLVVELLTTDAREIARTETQQEMQMALDYISRDIREAIYVYDGACLAGTDVTGKTENASTRCKGLFRSYIPATANRVPVLAFWRLDDNPEELCLNGQTGNTNDPNTPNCLAARNYSLVVYFLTKNQRNDPTNPWKGLARIERYQYSKYNSQGQPNSGYVEPTVDLGGFLGWPGDQSPDFSNVDAQVATLVDFVDGRGANDPKLKDALKGESLDVQCPGPYVLTPQKATLSGTSGDVRSFYACVKVPRGLEPTTESGAPSATGFNQKVTLFIRGNASGKPGIKEANEGFVPTLVTQVLNRSSRDKEPL
jgi:prepilin-type N-terminal cleavage/methylation domain-containing protein